MIGDRFTFEDEHQSSSQNRLPENKSSGLTALMISGGVAQNATQALLIQIGVSILLITIAIVLFAKKPNTDRYGNYDEIKVQHPELFVD